MNTASSVSTRSLEKISLRKILLTCGIFSSILYVFINIIVPLQYPGYNHATYTVSELSAIDAPTRTLWVILCSLYTLLVAAFGWGVLKSAKEKRLLRIVGILIIIYGIIGLAWPPMHRREVLAAGGGTLTDTLHIVFTIVTVMIMLFVIGFGALSFGKKFLIYSVITMIVMVVFGTMTGIEAPQMEANLPTPFIGVWERISIAAYLLWIMVLSVMLLQKNKVHNE